MHNLTSIRELKKRANNGDIKAMWQLGMRFIKGIDVDDNYPLAVKWLTRAANKGHISSKFQLAELYKTGVREVLARDSVKAMDLYEQAAIGGHGEALRVIGYSFVYGFNAPFSQVLPVRCEPPCEPFSPWPDDEPTRNYSFAYTYGSGFVDLDVRRDITKGIICLRHAVMRGNKSARENLLVLVDEVWSQGSWEIDEARELHEAMRYPIDTKNPKLEIRQLLRG